MEPGIVNVRSRNLVSPAGRLELLIGYAGINKHGEGDFLCLSGLDYNRDQI